MSLGRIEIIHAAQILQAFRDYDGCNHSVAEKRAGDLAYSLRHDPCPVELWYVLPGGSKTKLAEYAWVVDQLVKRSFGD